MRVPNRFYVEADGRREYPPGASVVMRGTSPKQVRARAEVRAVAAEIASAIEERRFAPRGRVGIHEHLDPGDEFTRQYAAAGSRRFAFAHCARAQHEADTEIGGYHACAWCERRAAWENTARPEVQRTRQILAELRRKKKGKTKQPDKTGAASNDAGKSAGGGPNSGTGLSPVDGAGPRSRNTVADTRALLARLQQTKQQQAANDRIRRHRWITEHANQKEKNR